MVLISYFIVFLFLLVFGKISKSKISDNNNYSVQEKKKKKKEEDNYVKDHLLECLIPYKTALPLRLPIASS